MVAAPLKGDGVGQVITRVPVVMMISSVPPAPWGAAQGTLGCMGFEGEEKEMGRQGEGGMGNKRGSAKKGKFRQRGRKERQIGDGGRQERRN